MVNVLIDPRSWEAARLLASREAETPGRLPREMVTQADSIRWTECGLQADLWLYLQEGIMADRREEKFDEKEQEKAERLAFWV